jgi:hypothetical protein
LSCHSFGQLGRRYQPHRRPVAYMPISSSVADSNTDYFSTPPSRLARRTRASGVPSGQPALLFVILEQGGDDLNGNLPSATDSIMGQWNYQYDNLNRLV